jgi:hypothetical protein
MSLVQCYVCDKKGSKTDFKRIINEGIKFECQTSACESIKQVKKMQEDEEHEKRKKQFIEERRLTEEAYLKENNLTKIPFNDNFFLAEKQYRDGCTRMVDPLTRKIVINSFVSEKLWTETVNELTANDLLKVEQFYANGQTPLETHL